MGFSSRRENVAMVIAAFREILTSVLCTASRPKSTIGILARVLACAVNEVAD
jgi:hypothetical protein